MSFPVTDPWEHLLAIGLGAGFGNAVANWEVRLQEDLDKKLSEVQSANNKRYIGKNASHCVISLQRLTHKLYNQSSVEVLESCPH